MNQLERARMIIPRTHLSCNVCCILYHARILYRCCILYHAVSEFMKRFSSNAGPVDPHSSIYDDDVIRLSPTPRLSFTPLLSPIPYDVTGKLSDDKDEPHAKLLTTKTPDQQQQLKQKQQLNGVARNVHSWPNVDSNGSSFSNITIGEQLLTVTKTKRSFFSLATYQAIRLPKSSHFIPRFSVNSLQ